MKVSILRFAALLALVAGTAPVADGATADYRWNGHAFVFCFVTDDGNDCNLGWAQVAREMGFRFTIAVNQSATTEIKLDAADLRALSCDGFEIANHGYGHGHTGVPLDCPIPPRGSLLAYTMCDGFAPGEAMRLFEAEIERDSLAQCLDVPVSEVRTVAYPNHRYSHAVIDSLIAEGYLGARYGENSSFSQFSYGEYTTPARNTWDGGISLFRVPLAAYSAVFFGNHSADPPVHYCYEQFLAATQPYIDQAVADGGMFVIYAHHFGDDDDSYGDVNYHSAGVTRQDLEWIVELVRRNGGEVMTFGDAVAYYRSRSRMTEIDGDYVWVPAVADVPAPGGGGPIRALAAPNPFNARTWIVYEVPASGEVDVDVFDLAGHLVRHLGDGFVTAGTHRLCWDGLSDAGLPESSGPYEVRVQAPRASRAFGITLLR